MDEVAQSHREIEDGLAGVDLTINSILEVSRDLRELTSRMASTFSWFGEVVGAAGPGEAAKEADAEGTRPAAGTAQRSAAPDAAAAAPAEDAEELEELEALPDDSPAASR